MKETAADVFKEGISNVGKFRETWFVRQKKSEHVSAAPFRVPKPLAEALDRFDEQTGEGHGGETMFCGGTLDRIHVPLAMAKPNQVGHSLPISVFLHPEIIRDGVFTGKLCGIRWSWLHLGSSLVNAFCRIDRRRRFAR